MGGKIVLPEMDDNVNKVVKNFMFTPTDISDFWKIFSKMDKAKTGLVPLVDIFKRVEMERNLITDCLLELLEIEHDGEINLSDFLYMVSEGLGLLLLRGQGDPQVLLLRIRPGQDGVLLRRRPQQPRQRHTQHHRRGHGKRDR
mmetsp:Transcript_23027/g.51627  ORF Transcript_23027/g.51627 Transcript_23027/m.51627 type:complete len:143 (+) Transcript_23027:229-657(+)